MAGPSGQCRLRSLNQGIWRSLIFSIQRRDQQSLGNIFNTVRIGRFTTMFGRVVQHDSVDELASWNAGPSLEAITHFLDAATEIPIDRRVAMFDNDGTLWCEKPRYVQLSFIVWAVKRRLKNDSLFKVTGDMKRLAQSGAQAVKGMSPSRAAEALNKVFEGLTPDEFTALAQSFAAEWTHPKAGPLRAARYQPMIELIAALKRRGFQVFVVTGGGIEFVRAISPSFYGVGPEQVVGSLVKYRYDPSRNALTRGADLLGAPDEGDEKVIRIQQMIGRRPVLAAGNSAGDQSMLNYSQAADGPTLALLINHDDAHREYAYKSVAATFKDTRDIVDVGRRSGWQVVSMRDDWAQVFTVPDAPAP